MALTTFSYADQADLRNYFNRMGDYDTKIQLYDFSTAFNLHTAYNTGYISMLYVNGSENTKVAVTPNSNGQWRYVAGTDSVEYFNDGYTSSTINDQIIEGGRDFADYIDQQLVNASLELHNLLDARYPAPLPKVMQTANSAASGVTPEYDPIIIRMTCYLAAATLIQSKNPLDEAAAAYYDKVTNNEGTGIADKLNAGSMKFSWEVDNADKSGTIAEITRAGSMYLVESAGDWAGAAHDIVRLTCTTGGVYGTAVIKAEYYGSDKLYGTEKTGIIVTGGLMSIINGLKVRFQGNSMTSSDVWEVTLKNAGRQITNAAVDSIEMVRA